MRIHVYARSKAKQSNKYWRTRDRIERTRVTMRAAGTRIQRSLLANATANNDAHESSRQWEAAVSLIEPVWRRTYVNRRSSARFIYAHTIELYETRGPQGKTDREPHVTKNNKYGVERIRTLSSRRNIKARGQTIERGGKQ